jgi:hypothetical protein
MTVPQVEIRDGFLVGCGGRGRVLGLRIEELVCAGEAAAILMGRSFSDVGVGSRRMRLVELMLGWRIYLIVLTGGPVVRPCLVSLL